LETTLANATFDNSLYARIEPTRMKDEVDYRQGVVIDGSPLLWGLEGYTSNGARKTGSFARSLHGRIHGVPGNVYPSRPLSGITIMSDSRTSECRSPTTLTH
jgi:hypothetical protein